MQNAEVQLLILRNQMERMRGPFSEPGDAYDAWFKVETLDAAEMARRQIDAYRQSVETAAAVVRSAGYAVPPYATMGRAAMQGMNTLARNTRKDDPADPELAVQEPKPKRPAPSGSSMDIESARHVHDAAMRAAEIQTRNGSPSAADFAKAYIAAASAIQDSW